MAIATLPQVNTPFTMDNPIFDVGQFQAMMQVAEVMAKAKLVPEHLQGKPADCLLVVEQSRRWNMSPFAVAQETYVVKGKLLFGGKLVTAVINSRAPVKSPLKFDFEDEDKGDRCRVTVSATLKGEDGPRTYSISVGEAKAVAGNSTLWKTDPKQQVVYFAARFWARRHCPETLLGVWSEDEVDEPPPMRDVTPRDHERAAAPPVEILLVDPDGEEWSLLPGEAEARVAQWCAECTDEQLTLLIENNPRSGLVAAHADVEAARRAAKPKADNDPLGIKGMSAKQALEAIDTAIRASGAADADGLWRFYRERVRKLSEDAFNILESVVLEKIGNADQPSLM